MAFKKRPFGLFKAPPDLLGHSDDQNDNHSSNHDVMQASNTTVMPHWWRCTSASRTSRPGLLKRIKRMRYQTHTPGGWMVEWWFLLPNVVTSNVLVYLNDLWKLVLKHQSKLKYTHVLHTGAAHSVDPGFKLSTWNSMFEKPRSLRMFWFSPNLKSIARASRFSSPSSIRLIGYD